MSKDLQLVRHRKTSELQHRRRIKRGDVAVPDVASHAGKEDVGITAFEWARHRRFGKGKGFSGIPPPGKGVGSPGGAAGGPGPGIIWEKLLPGGIDRAQHGG